jgi:hypothetical protein
MTILDSKLNFPLALFGVTCCLAAASPAKALTITSIDQGWYSDSQPHSTSNRNYSAGSSSQNLRNFFVFNLPNYPISFASFAVPTYIVSADNQTFSLYGFGGNISDLVSGTSSYSALGQGPSFDSLIYNISDSNGAKTFTFNPSGISYLNTLLGAQVAITGDNPSGGYVFGFSNDNLLNATLTINDALPPSQSVPAPLPVFGAAAAFQASRRLKSRIRQSSRSMTNRSIRLDRVGIDA